MIFYEPSRRDRAVLAHDPFKALVAPRPIGWVSTMAVDGSVNLAPYSAMECRAVHRLELCDVEGRPTDQHLVIGQVVGVHLDEDAIVDGAVDTRRLLPVARLGGPADYAVVEDLFHMWRPGE